MAIPSSNIPPDTMAENKGPQVVASMIVLAVLAIFSVILRLASRKIKNLGFGLDDWLIVASSPLAIALAVVTACATTYGLGKHISAVAPTTKLITYAKLFLVTQLLWAAATPLVKLSILVLYLRIFGHVKYMRWFSFALIAFTISWMISVLLVLGFQCRPISKVWDMNIDGVCINSTPFFLTGSATDVFTDFVILVLPMYAVWTLQTSLSKRLVLLGIFALGSLTCIISLVRLIELADSLSGESDMTWATTFPSIWSAAEPCLGIVCANLPTLRPFFQFLGESYQRLTSKKATISSSTYADTPVASDVSGTSKPSKTGSNVRSDSSQRLYILEGRTGFTSVQSSATHHEPYEMRPGWSGTGPHTDQIYSTTTIDVHSE